MKLSRNLLLALLQQVIRLPAWSPAFFGAALGGLLFNLWLC